MGIPGFRGANDPTPAFLVSYDPENGEVQTYFDGVMREVIEVRVRMTDDVLRQAVIVELEKLGYTVLSPEAKVPH
jgi:hypothetical protein